MNAYTRHYNTIVIGVGGMGSATCYELAKRGQSVLGIEQFDIPHDQGSSHGYTRIIRLAYYEHPSYVMLLRRAYELWAGIEQVAGERLLYKVGSIDAGPADSWVFKGSFRSAVALGIEHEVLSGLELSRRFPGYRLPQDTMALYQKDGGFLTPERCVVAYVNAALAFGAEIHGRETVLGWEPRGDGVRVFTDRATYEADALVFAAGSWNSQLMPWLRGLATPELQALIWMQPERPEYFRLDNFPVFNCLVDEGRFYGFPVFGVPGFKFGKYHHFEEQGAPERIKREPSPADEAVLRDFAARYFPTATGPTLTLKTCMFTNAPDGHFIVDLHPEFPQVSFASACSGHGYKFASVIGEMLADLAERQQCRHDLSLFALSRFGGRLSKLHRDKVALIERGLPGEEQRLGHQGGARGEGRGARGTLHSRQNGATVETTDLRYWQAADVKPFW